MTTTDDDDDLLLTAEETMNRAMALLPDALTAEYREACRWVPELVEKESNPRWFLSFHPSDPLAAARRLANYWKKRKEVFEERAFLPIDLSGNGALTADDVRVLKTGYMVNLPRDNKGCSVIYMDNSKKRPDMIPSRRTIFFVGQCMMENEKTRTDGFVGLWNISNPFAVDFDKKNQECGRFLMKECMPVKQFTKHLCYISPPGMNIMPLFINTVFTWAVNFIGFYYEKYIFAHVASCKEECLAKLLNYDFSPDGLPVGLGGSWTGGCEPWRKEGSGTGGPDGGDELKLEIETELSCLFRNALWLHNQTIVSSCPPDYVSTTYQQQQQLEATTASSSSSMRVAAAAAADAVVHYHITGESEKRIIKCTTPRSRRQECGMNKDLTNRQGVATTSMATVADGAEKRHAEPCDDKEARRRRMHTEADRVRRAKERIEIEVLQEQVLKMTQMNQSLKEEQQRLEGLVQKATIDMTGGLRLSPGS